MIKGQTGVNKDTKIEQPLKQYEPIKGHYEEKEHGQEDTFDSIQTCYSVLLINTIHEGIAFLQPDSEGTLSVHYINNVHEHKNTVGNPNECRVSLPHLLAPVLLH